MIVGNGMVAKALKGLSGWEDDILFSSGVSNSGEREQAAFQKEIDLIEHHLSQIKPEATFVYFSTTSVFDPEKSQNPYIIHKLEIEKMLKDKDVNYLIIRLPNLVGSSKNPHTLTNFFADSIRLQRPVKLNSNAIRHLIDAEDLIPILQEINRLFGKQKLTVNVQTDRPLQAEQILRLLEETMSKKAPILLQSVHNTGNKPASADEISSKNFLWRTGENYHRNLFRKYYSG